VAGIVQQILQQQSQANSKGGATAGGGSRLVAAPNAAQQLTTQLNPGQPSAGGANPAGTQTAPDSSSVVVQADRRTNRILISGKKADVAYIEKLIHEFDLPSEMQNFVTYPLRFIRVTEFIDLATGALEARGFGASTGGGGGSAAGGGARQASGNGYPSGQSGSGGSNTGMGAGGNTRYSQNATSSRSSGSSSSSRSSGGGGISGGGGSRGGAGGSTSNTQALPTSVSVGKTLLISDPQSNAIIVSGTPEAKDQIRILIQQMDKRPLQVHIDCILAELALTDSYEFGIDLLRKVDTMNIAGKTVQAAGLLKNIANGTGIIDPATLASLAAFPAGASGLNAYFSVNDLVNGYVKASEGTNKLKIVQKPSVSTSNNEPAFISIGERVPYPGQQQTYLGNTGANNSGSVNSTVDYQDVVLSLDVTPLINSREEVTLQIQQINDNVIGETIINNNPVPKIGQQSLNTKLTVPNHGIAIIGGLIADNRLTSISGVPLLARIPIIRNLLGNTTKKDTRRELLIFIQPNIMAGPDDMIEINSKEIARTAVGPHAERFARPEVDMSGTVMPTANGNIPFDSAGYPKDQQPGFWRRLGGIFKRKPVVPPDTTEPTYPR
jgi:general secretion pathway protein D